MTTFAYSRKESIIAIDGRLTSDDIIQSDTFEKYQVAESGAVYFIVGAVSDALEFIQYIEEGFEIIDEDINISANVIRVKDGKPCIYGVECGQIWNDELSTCDYRTYGTGAPYALSAMDMGKTAKQAVEYAMTRDIYTGGKVTTYNIKTGKFK